MFKSSGTMRLVGDKEVLKSIWDVYSCMEELKKFVDMYYQHKLEECMKELQLYTDEKPATTPPMYVFYTSTMDSSLKKICQESLQNIKQTLSKL